MNLFKNSFLFILFFTAIKSFAQENEIYIPDTKISVPGNGGYDYLTVDKPTNRLYVSHGTTMNVIDLNSDKVIATIDNLQGIHGIAIANEFGKGFISDGKANSVVVFDLKTLKKLKSVPVKGEGPDAIMYDPYTKKVFCFNGESKNISVVDAKTDELAATVSLDGSPEFGVSDGKGMVYDNLEDKNSIAVIDTKSMKEVKSYSLSPSGGPTALYLDQKNHRLFSGCREDKNLCVVDEQTGKVITRLPIGAGVDAIVYDPETKLVLCSNSDGTTTVVRQESADQYKIVQTLKTQYRAKTMALDPQTHKIYLSVARFEQGSRTPLPDSFEVLVYKLK